MGSNSSDNSDFLEQLRGDLSVYHNFSGIFEKCLQEDHVGAVLLVFGDIFRKELGFVVSSGVTRTGPDEPLQRGGPENGSVQPVRVQRELQDRRGHAG
jgi:hypothetical protein